ncbi:transcription factor MYB88-like [Rutidosis leptorrhynchoides]|uniref:transcription factor MYB88-like n=1 Tax=Rutidosis leptorrhynchoides TaxID=125765 RepID=UPI003A994870
MGRKFNPLEYFYQPKISTQPFFYFILLQGGWSSEEDTLLCEAHNKFRNRWNVIGKVVPGRTDNAVKNRFSVIRRRRAHHEIVLLM